MRLNFFNLFELIINYNINNASAIGLWSYLLCLAFSCLLKRKYYELQIPQHVNRS